MQRNLQQIEMKKKCKECGNEFRPFKTTDKYCSYSCASKNEKPKEQKKYTLKRTAINTPIEKKIEYQKRMRERAISKGTDKIPVISKKRKAFNKEYDKQRGILKAEVVLKNGKECCQKCGTDKSIMFSTHHIVFRSEKPNHPEMNNRKNLIYLCHDCHEGFHDNKLSRNYLIKERGLESLFGKIWGYD